MGFVFGAGTVCALRLAVHFDAASEVEFVGGPA
jgi:hypothetical protein